MAANPTKFNQGADGRTKKVPAPVFRGNLRSQRLNLTYEDDPVNDNNWYMYEGDTLDKTERIFLVSVREYDRAAPDTTVARSQAYLYIYNDVVTLVNVLHDLDGDGVVNDETYLIVSTDTDSKLRIWYDSTNDRLVFTNRLGAGDHNAEVTITNMTA